MEDQDELIIRKSECEELGLEANTKAVLEDVGHLTQICILSIKRTTRKIRLGSNKQPGQCRALCNVKVRSCT